MPKGKRMLIVLSVEDLELVREAARRAALPVATFIRMAAIHAAKKGRKP